MQFGRRVFWPVTTSVAIKKSSTNHVHQTFQMSGSKLDLYENIFSHIVFPIHYASSIVFQVHWFDSWLERKISIFPKSWPQRWGAPLPDYSGQLGRCSMNSITVSGRSEVTLSLTSFVLRELERHLGAWLITISYGKDDSRRWPGKTMGQRKASQELLWRNTDIKA